MLEGYVYNLLLECILNITLLSRIKKKNNNYHYKNKKPNSFMNG